MTSKLNWVARRPVPASAVSYPCVIRRAAVRSARHTQSRHSSSLESCRCFISSLNLAASTHNDRFGRLSQTTAWQDASLRLFDFRENAFHLFFAEGAQCLTLGVTERAVL